MKKAVFTIQMIALMAMFPVYLVVELNHENGRKPEKNTSSPVIEMAEKILTKPALNNVESQFPVLMHD